MNRVAVSLAIWSGMCNNSFNSDGSGPVELPQNTTGTRMSRDCSRKQILPELLTTVHWNLVQAPRGMVSTYFLRVVEGGSSTNSNTCYSRMLGILGKLNIFPYILRYYILKTFKYLSNYLKMHFNCRCYNLCWGCEAVMSQNNAPMNHCQISCRGSVLYLNL